MTIFIRERNKPLGADTRRGTPLDKFISKFTWGRLGVITSVEYYSQPCVDPETLEPLFPSDSRVKSRLIKT